MKKINEKILLFLSVFMLFIISGFYPAHADWFGNNDNQGVAYLAVCQNRPIADNSYCSNPDYSSIKLAMDVAWHYIIFPEKNEIHYWVDMSKDVNKLTDCDITDVNNWTCPTSDSPFAGVEMIGGQFKYDTNTNSQLYNSDDAQTTDTLSRTYSTSKSDHAYILAKSTNGKFSVLTYLYLLYME